MTRSNAFRPPWDAPQPEPAQPTSSDARVPAERRWVEWLARRHPIVDILREDRQRNDGISSPGFQAVASQRLARWAASGEAPRWARGPVGRAARAGQWVARSVYGIEIPAEVSLGRRIRVAHQSGIVVHRDAVIGDDVTLRQNVTIGLHRDDVDDQAHNVPTIGDGVSLGAGAVVVGPVAVGAGARVGANAVVTEDVPAGGKAVLPKGVVSGPDRLAATPRAS